MILVTLLKGVLIGIVIAIPVGPVGVLCIRRTLFEGPTFGFISGLGAATADTLFAVIAGFGLAALRDRLFAMQDWLGLAGAVFLLYLGIRSLRGGPSAEPEPVDGEALLGAYASAFALTITNPLTILMFATVFAKVGGRAAMHFSSISVLVLGVFLGSLLWWLGISFGLGALRHSATTFPLRQLNRISGAILVLSGIGLLIAALLGLFGIAH